MEIWRLVFYGAAVILIMISRPKGLMGGMELTPAGISKARKERRARIEALREMKGDQGGEVRNG